MDAILFVMVKIMSGGGVPSQSKDFNFRGIRQQMLEKNL